MFCVLTFSSDRLRKKNEIWTPQKFPAIQYIVFIHFEPPKKKGPLFGGFTALTMHVTVHEA